MPSTQTLEGRSKCSRWLAGTMVQRVLRVALQCMLQLQASRMLGIQLNIADCVKHLEVRQLAP